MKIIKVDNCKKCIYYTSRGIWQLDPEAGTGTEHNQIYTNRDKLYCSLKRRKNEILGKFIGIANGEDDFVKIPKWCPLEDYKEAKDESNK